MNAAQLAIDFNPVHAVRASDPLTSIKAAENASRFATSQAGRILQALKLHGPRTAHDLSQLLGLSVEQICRRLPNLKRDNLARVQTLDDGADVEVDGFRVWEAVA